MAKVKRTIKRMTSDLVPHYKALTQLCNENKLKEALKYLSNLPTDVYDRIIERSSKGGKFKLIFLKLESLEEKSNFKLEEEKRIHDLETIIF